MLGKHWFSIHVGLAVLAALMILASFIVIITEVGLPGFYGTHHVR
jgi:hypothetical protein